MSFDRIDWKDTLMNDLDEDEVTLLVVMISGLNPHEMFLVERKPVYTVEQQALIGKFRDAVRRNGGD